MSSFSHVSVELLRLICFVVKNIDMSLASANSESFASEEFHRSCWQRILTIWQLEFRRNYFCLWHVPNFNFHENELAFACDAVELARNRRVNWLPIMLQFDNGSGVRI